VVAYYAMDEGTGWNLRERVSNNATAGIIYYEVAHQVTDRSDQTEANWVEDEYFGRVLACGKKDGEQKDLIELEDVDYGRTGKFTINIWFRHDQENLENFFGHGDPAQLRVARNQIHWQFQDTGSIRTIMMDGNDIDQYTCPHCEGKTAVDQCRFEAACTAPYSITTDTLQEQHGVVDSGDLWHMLTLTTHPDGSPGWTVYLDGQVRSRLPYDGHGRYFADLDQLVQIPGGDPVDPEGTMRICGRYVDFQHMGFGAGLVDNRYFLGKVGHASFFDTAMTEAQVGKLLAAYIDHFHLPRPANFQVWSATTSTTSTTTIATGATTSTTATLTGANFLMQSSSNDDSTAKEAVVLAAISLVISVLAFVGVVILFILNRRGKRQDGALTGNVIGKTSIDA